jgi:O-antigen/teichoic acid export membrane protein
VAILSSLILLPILFRLMDREELGVWQLLGNSQAFVGLLDLGVAAVLTRHIALARGRSGADPDLPLTPESRQHIADLVATGRAVLRWLAVLAFLVALAAGAIFLTTLELSRVSTGQALAAWLLLCVGYAVGVWMSYLECWMAGVGYVGATTLIATAVAVLALLANIAAVLSGGGIVTLAAILVAAGLVQRGFMRYALRRTVPDLFRLRGAWRGPYARALIRPALATWLTVVGAFLALQTDAYFIARFRGAADLPPYLAAHQIVNNLLLLAATFAASSSVFISHAWQAGAHDRVRAMTIRSAQSGMVVMAAGVGFALVAGRDFIELWLGPGAFVGSAVLAVFCAMQTLGAQHLILAHCARSTEDERYAVIALAAGALNLGLTWALIGPLGLLGVALGTLIAQLLTSNWYAVYRPFVRLGLDARAYFRRVVLLWAATLGGTVLAGHALAAHLRDLERGRAWVVCAAAAVAGSALAAALWWGVLDRPHRHKLVHWLHLRLARRQLS